MNVVENGPVTRTFAPLTGSGFGIGFPQKAVPYVRDPRFAGKTKWTYGRLWNLAVEGITSFTIVPLKPAT